MFDEGETIPAARLEAIELFRRAYAAQHEDDYDRAIELYRRSIDAYPTAEAHTFLGWVYSFQRRYDEAIDECLRAIGVDADFGNPYNDIGSYLLARGDRYNCVRWFRSALRAPLRGPRLPTLQPRPRVREPRPPAGSRPPLRPRPS
jgi:tetratricopeptide (TPR) repeat protein